jgi:phage shock protein A
MNLIEQLSLLTRAKMGDVLNTAKGETTGHLKSAKLDQLLADADKRIARLLAEQKKALEKTAQLVQDAKTSQSAVDAAEQEVDAALRAGDDALARARLTRAKAMRIKAEEEEKRAQTQEKMAAQLEREIAALQDQTRLAREKFADAQKPRPAPEVAPAPESHQPVIKQAEPPAVEAAPVEDISLAEALRRMKENASP